MFKRIDCELCVQLYWSTAVRKSAAESEEKNEPAWDMSLQQRPIVAALLNRSSSPISVTTDDAHQPRPIIVHQLPCMFYRWRCLDLSHDPLVVVYNIPAWDKVSLTVCSEDIKAPKLLVNLLGSGVGQNRRTTRRRKTSLNSPYPPQSTAFHSNSCWYLLFLWW